MSGPESTPTESPSNPPIILWMSRHDPLPAQLRELKKRLGDYHLVHWPKKISTDERAIQIIKELGARYVIPVIPESIVNRLVEVQEKHGFRVLIPVMEQLHLCKSDQCEEFDPDTDAIVVSRDMETGETIRRHFRFRGFVWRRRVVYEDEPTWWI